MSAITHETASARHLPAAVGFLRKTAVKSARLLMRASNAFAEARIHRAMIEAELYRNRYRHASKNDDELPIAIQGERSSPEDMTWRRFADAAVAMAKRAYPAIVVLSLLSTALAATIAIRLAIWLPGHLF